MPGVSFLLEICLHRRLTKSADERTAASCSKVWGGLWNSDLDDESSKGCRRPKFCVAVPAGRDSRLRGGDWRTKKTMPFLRSAAEPLASLVEKIRRSSRLVPLRFSGFRAAKTGGNRSDRLISLEGGVQPGVHGVGKVRYGIGGRNWGNFNWENLPARLSLGAFAKQDYQG